MAINMVYLSLLYMGMGWRAGEWKQKVVHLTFFGGLTENGAIWSIFVNRSPNSDRAKLGSSSIQSKQFWVKIRFSWGS